MAKRLTSTFKLNTESVQGEGSFAIIRRVNVKEQRQIMEMVDNEAISAFDLGCHLLKQNVLEWNWVDDDDQPLPNPKDDTEVIELLTDDEIKILGEAIYNSELKLKN